MLQKHIFHVMYALTFNKKINGNSESRKDLSLFFHFVALKYRFISLLFWTVKLMLIISCFITANNCTAMDS